MPAPLFFIGNRRSGTTMMTYVINQHKRIYMGMETDILWYLYSDHATYPHPDDDIKTLRKHDQSILSTRVREKDKFIPDDMLTGNVRVDFFKDLMFTKEFGILGRQDNYPGKCTNCLRYVGDKKPAQTTDPKMRSWVKEHFPDAKHIHLVRDPRDSIASMVGMGWAGGDVDFLTEYWVRLEKQALEISDRIFVRYEDVVENPMKEMTRICGYLNLKPEETQESYDPQGRMELRRGVVMAPGYSSGIRAENLDIPMTADLKKLMGMYGY